MRRFDVPAASSAMCTFDAKGPFQLFCFQSLIGSQPSGGPLFSLAGEFSTSTRASGRAAPPIILSNNGVESSDIWREEAAMCEICSGGKVEASAL
eukprot:scaffold312469_cov31-Tisochrysis_lutea.AAC.1